MEIIKASIKEGDDKYYIVIQAEEEINIPLTEDNPSTIKDAFNSLILLLKKKVFEIQLQGDGKDLIWNVANEYLKQLNEELVQIRTDIEHYNLQDNSKDDG